MKYFLFSLTLHFLIFGMVIWKNYWFAESQRESKIIIEIISLDSDTGRTNLFPEKRKALRKSQRKIYSTPKNASFSKKSSEKSNLTRQEKAIVGIRNFEKDSQQGLSNKESSNAKHKDRMKLNYVQQLKNYIEENKFYPRAALKLNQTGVVKIRLEIAPDGLFKNITIMQASGYENLNRAALKLVKSLRQFKPLPGIFQSSTPFIIPIAYVR